MLSPKRSQGVSGEDRRLVRLYIYRSVKISDLIPMLSTLMREVGNAEVCVQVGKNDPQTIGSVSTALNMSLPDTHEEINLVILKVPN